MITKPNCKIVESCQGTKKLAFTVREMSIAPGPTGTLETLRVMASLSRDAVSYQDFCSFMADMICSQIRYISPMNIDSYLRSVYRYRNEDIETLYAPAYNVWQMKQTGFLTGDCDDISMMYAAVFNALGMRARFVAMRTKPNDENFYHVVPEVFYESRWRRYDATVPSETVHVDYGLMVVDV